MTKYKRNILSVFFCTVLIISCKNFDTVQSTRDFSKTASINYEISLARKNFADKPLQGLCRAKVLLQNTSDNADVLNLYRDAVQNAQKAFLSAAEKKDWYTALIFYQSLQSLGEAPQNWTEEKIRTAQKATWKELHRDILLEIFEDTKATPQDEAPSIQTVAKMIKGTTTVWVDKGIRVEKGRGFSDKILGSGFFIDKRGYFITNYHVIQSEVDPEYEGYSRVYIKPSANKNVKIPAKVIGWDSIFDLALLKTEIEPEVVFKLGSSEGLSIGSKIYAIGSPAGLDKTLTSGIVSAKNRKLFSLGDALQIDASVNPGSSGGPIVDEKGNVQAIVFAGLESLEGLNFAIPVEFLKLILPDLYRGGKVEHSWLGAFGQVLAPRALSNTKGVKLLYTIPGCPAALAIVPEQSIITAINDTPIDTIEKLQQELLHYSPDTIIKISGYALQDKNKPDTIDSYVKKDWFVQTAARPEFPVKLIYEKDLSYRAFTPLFGFEFGSTGKKNTYRVERIVSGTFADENEFTQGDVIEIQRVRINEENKVVIADVYAKRRKAGYFDSFMQFGQYLDNPLFF
ncbi:serine protease [Treponema phagedenis]|uniref:S1C family serine protease n=1 Tax=Treponema phagedenis TaxID=162 RepID=UPI0011E6F65F|nr:S1C family serine protease [Treponema phagedenis]QEK00315.1 serine protease [Treponema phagedenis]